MPTNWLDAEADALRAEIPDVVESVIAWADQEHRKGNIEKGDRLLSLAACLEAGAHNLANLDAFRRQAESDGPPIDALAEGFSRN